MILTTAARRIAKFHNARLKSGFAGSGFILVSQDGNGGAWYTNGSRPVACDAIKISIQWKHMTVAQAQAILDAQ